MASARLRPLPRVTRLRSSSAPLTYSDPERLADWTDWTAGWDEERSIPDGSVPPTSFTFRQRASEKLRKRSSALDIEAVQSLGGQRIAGTRELGRTPPLSSSVEVASPLRQLPEPDYDDFRSVASTTSVRPRFRREVDFGDDGSLWRRGPPARQLSHVSDREDDYAYAYDCIVSPAAVILSEMDDEEPPVDPYAYSGSRYNAARENIYEELDELARKMRNDPESPEVPPPPPKPRYSGDVHTEVQQVQRSHSQVMGELRLDMEAMLMPSQRWSDLEVPVGPTDELLSPDSGFHSGSGASGSTFVSNYDTPDGPRAVTSPLRASATGGAALPRMRKCESLDLKDALSRSRKDWAPSGSSAGGPGGEKRLWKLSSVISGLLGRYHKHRSKDRDAWT